jgi:hypothetical protein
MKVAVVKWSEGDGVTKAIQFELERLGHYSESFLYNQTIPKNVDVVLSHAPLNRFIPIAAQLGKYHFSSRPVFIHYSTETPPDISIPWPLMKFFGDIRLGIDLLNDSRNKILRITSKNYPISWINNRFQRFRHVSEYSYAHHKGWLDILFDSSDINANFWRSHGLPAYYIPWGVPSAWYADMKVNRDIGVLWMGLRRTPHRSRVIDTVKKEMSIKGIPMFIADGIEHPFIYNEERTTILNRSMITLNIQTERNKNILPMRFVVAAANRSFVLSEPTPPHAPEIIDNKHYISTASNLFVNKITVLSRA